MSNRNRFTAAALGVVVGVGIALLFLVWAFPGFRNPTYQQGRYQNSQNSETGKNNPVIRPSLWETYTSPTDTYAQWIAALSALFGIGVSTWAVWLVRRTLNANTEAVGEARTANEIAGRSNEAQLRAYVSVSSIEIIQTSGGYQPNIRVKIKNFGQTPAYNLIHRSSHRFHKLGQPLFFTLGDHRAGKMDLAPTQDMVKTILVSLSAWGIYKPLLEANPRTAGHAADLYVFGEVTYDTAFAKGRVTRYRVKLDVDDTGVVDGESFFLCREGNEST